MAFNEATRDLAIIKDTRSSELRKVTAPYAFVLASVKVCNLSFVGSKVVEVYLLSIEILGSQFMSFTMLSHSLLKSVSKGSSHSIFDFHSFCIMSFEWIVTGIANPIRSKINS